VTGRLSPAARIDGMAVAFELDPPITDELRERVVELWVEVTNAGGAVGFVPPVGADDVRPLATASLAAVEDGPDHLLIQTDDGELTGLLFVVDNRFAFKDHWRVLKRVMVTPRGQGRGLGTSLMRQAEHVGRAMGLAALQITVRAGAGTEKFYERLGYTEVGRLPGALRVGPHDDRDEIYMWMPLTG
jgi:GNAT superfamily N-acetyltransferase